TDELRGADRDLHGGRRRRARLPHPRAGGRLRSRGALLALRRLPPGDRGIRWTPLPSPLPGTGRDPRPEPERAAAGRLQRSPTSLTNLRRETGRAFPNEEPAITLMAGSFTISASLLLLACALLGRCGLLGRGLLGPILLLCQFALPPCFTSLATLGSRASKRMQQKSSFCTYRTNFFHDLREASDGTARAWPPGLGDLSAALS